MPNFSRSNYIKDKVQKYSANIAGIVNNYNDPVGLAKELTDLFKNAIEDTIDKNVKDASEADKQFANMQKKGDDFIYAKDNNTIYSYSGNDTIISYNNDIVYAGNDDDTLISKANNSTLQGENGNDTYIITKEATNTTIKDKELINLIEGGDDTLILQGVKKEEISFKLDGVFMQDLVIRYGSDNNTTLTIKNQTNKYSQIETIKLDDNSFISNEQIDKIIQQVNAYTSDNGISNITNDEARNNQAIMQIYASGWGS
ncbi:hypothetical protein [Campylobacter geochelonis]|uniref:hypothetical protein n=1 Tax=Campylobacter geochelonis TaxID=1780362 RepID=UPI00155DA66C|nr:hypothetical protein [Campylobacter geochelonis]QKF71484.1 hypothetical protein CGEO_1186 [Campylobacter geochelonis]